MSNSKLKKYMKAHYDEYMSIKLNGGWERYIKNIEKFKQEVDEIDDNDIKQLRIQRKKELDDLCDKLSCE